MLHRAVKSNQKPTDSKRSPEAGPQGKHSSQDEGPRDRLTRIVLLFIPIMMLLALAFLLLGTTPILENVSAAKNNDQEVLGSGVDGERYKMACPDYKHYSTIYQ